jgi:hypothetical protein
MATYEISYDVLERLARLRELEEQGIQVGKVDFHTISRGIGINNMAEALHLTPRLLISKRDATRQFSASELLMLQITYPEFDWFSTVLRLERKRVQARRDAGKGGHSTIPEGWLAKYNDEFWGEE